LFPVTNISYIHLYSGRQQVHHYLKLCKF